DRQRGKPPGEVPGAGTRLQVDHPGAVAPRDWVAKQEVAEPAETVQTFHEDKRGWGGGLVRLKIHGDRGEDLSRVNERNARITRERAVVPKRHEKITLVREVGDVHLHGGGGGPGKGAEITAVTDEP